MSAVGFTRADVEAAAGVSPWRTQEQFSAEISPEDIGATAVAYRRALAEARISGDVAERASELAADAGSADGRSLADARERVAETDRDLGDRGDAMETVADYLIRSMDAALTFEQKVRSAVEDVLDPRLAEAGAAVARLTADALPDEARVIRDGYLAGVVQDTWAVNVTVENDIAEYRSVLARYGQELTAHGYDLTGGPLGLWSSPEMARHMAGQLKSLLSAGGEPDRALLLLSTETLRSLARDVMDGRDTPRGLSRAETLYLMDFFSALDSDTLAALGNLGEDGIEPAEGDWQRQAYQGIADGAMLLWNFGVLDADGQDALPFARALAGMQPYVQPGSGPLFDHEPGSDAFKAALEKYNGFGTIMAHATVPGDDLTSAHLARAAVSVQERSARQYEPRDYFLFELAPDTFAENTGGGGLLHAAALNEVEAARQLANPAFADRLLRQQWEDSREVSAYIAAGTRGPGGDAPEGSLQALARDTVLEAAEKHRDAVEGTGPQEKYGHTEHYYLRETLASLAEHRTPTPH